MGKIELKQKVLGQHRQQAVLGMNQRAPEPGVVGHLSASHLRPTTTPNHHEHACATLEICPPARRDASRTLLGCARSCLVAATAPAA